jgi:hypothetical protein
VASDGTYGTHGTYVMPDLFSRPRWCMANRELRTVNGELLRRVKAAVDWQG